MRSEVRYNTVELLETEVDYIQQLASFSAQHAATSEYRLFKLFIKELSEGSIEDPIACAQVIMKSTEIPFDRNFYAPRPPTTDY